MKGLAATGNTLGNELKGNSAANLLTGDAGNDRLIGGGGKDTLTGGADADTFVFETLADGIDRILDFTAGEDVLEFSAAGFLGGLVASFAPTVVNAGGLINTGTITVESGQTLGGASAPTTLNINAAAPATWTGLATLIGQTSAALLEFASGGITAIAKGASLFLNGADALVALASDPTHNSALTGLASNAGSLLLLYDTLTKAAQGGDAKALRDAAGTLVESYPRTLYASMGALLAAKLYFERNDLKNAKAQLQWAI